MTRDLDVCYLQLGHYVRKFSLKFQVFKRSLMIIHFQLAEDVDNPLKVEVLLANCIFEYHHPCGK